MKSNQEELNFMHLMHVLIWRYIDPNIAKTNTEFEAYLHNNIGPNALPEKEVAYAINHFKKQIYPLDKKQVEWMFKNIKRENYFYYDIAQEIKKLKF